MVDYRLQHFLIFNHYRFRISSAYAARMNSAVTDDNSLVQAPGTLLSCSRAAQFVTPGSGPDFLRGEIDLTVGIIPRWTPILLMLFRMCHPGGDPLTSCMNFLHGKLSQYKFVILKKKEDKILVLNLAWSWGVTRCDATYYGRCIPTFRRNLQAVGFSKYYLQTK
jgi:hypothetical protein